MGEEKKEVKQKEVKDIKTEKKEVKTEVKPETKVEVKTEKKENTKKVEEKPLFKKETDKKGTENKKIDTKPKKAKTGRNIAISVISILVILAVVIGVTFMCAASTPKKTVEGMLDSLKTGDFKNAEEFVNFNELMNLSEASDNETMNEEAQKLFFDRLNWKVTNVTENGENATVEVEVTNKDFKVVIGNYMQKALKAAFSGQTVGEQDFENYLLEELKNEQVQTATQTKTIQTTKKDGKWMVVVNEDLVNLLLPGLQESINSLS